MTSMKSFELANLGTNRTVPLIGHETMSYLMLTNGIWANTRSQGHEMNPQPFFTNLAKVVSKATAKIEAFLERKVYLRLFVKAVPGWTRDPIKARQLAIKEGET